MEEIFDKHEGIIDLIAVDTGAGETYIQPRIQRLPTDVEASKSHAIGVGGTQWAGKPRVFRVLPFWPLRGD